MKNIGFILLIALYYLFSAPDGSLFAQTFSDQKKTGLSSAERKQAEDLIAKTLEAMGGAKKLNDLSSLQIEGIGHQLMVEQSERPDGPYVTIYKQINEIRDLKNGDFYQETETRMVQFSGWFKSNFTAANGRAAIRDSNGKIFPGNVSQVEDAKMLLSLAPEKIFFTALKSPDLRIEKTVEMQGVPQRKISFTWENREVAVYVNSFTNLPTAVETKSDYPYSIFWNIWGDVTSRTFYTLWTLEPGGIRYPRQWDIVRNGYPLESFTITKLAFDATVDQSKLQIPLEVQQSFDGNPRVKISDWELGLTSRPAVEIAPGIIKIPGRWDVALIDQGDDGIVVLEAPISSSYSKKVLDAVKSRFPGKKVKAAITTSDAFPHFGGVREYVAQKIPLYALDLNGAILNRVIAAPHQMRPDNLENKPQKPRLNLISQKTSVGTGVNRLQIIPFRTETGERMMMVYFPEHKLLYASDLIQRRPNGEFFMPQYLSEAVDAAEREKLEVKNVFAMHLDLTPWSEIIAAVRKRAGNP